MLPFVALMNFCLFLLGSVSFHHRCTEDSGDWNLEWFDDFDELNSSPGGTVEILAASVAGWWHPASQVHSHYGNQQFWGARYMDKPLGSAPMSH